MSNTEASEENIKSPSTYGEKGYREYRKKEKIKKKKDPEEGLNRVTNYSKYAVGGESKEVPASAGSEQNQPKQKKSTKQ
ncbi:MAG: hypothetical protein ACP5OH_03690 [Nitrososphaerota archaeon]